MIMVVMPRGRGGGEGWVSGVGLPARPYAAGHKSGEAASDHCDSRGTNQSVAGHQAEGS